jgi:hypothetical protein
MGNLEDPLNLSPLISGSIQEFICFKRCRVLPDVGVEIYVDSQDLVMRKQILFG